MSYEPGIAAQPVRPPTILDTRHRTAVLAVMCLALVMVVANVSMLNVGLRTIAIDLGASSTELHWIVDSYAVAFAALLLPLGAFGDRLGRRRVMLAGIAVLFAGSIAAALAGSPTTLIAARVVSGVGAAMVMPGTLSTITHVFPPEERGKGVGVWAGFASAGGILGLLFGGTLLEGFSWPSLFWGMAATAAITAAGVVAIVPESKDAAEANLDPVGAVLSATGIGILVFGVIEGPAAGWTSPATLTALAAGVAALIAFVRWELRVERPLLDVRLFRERAFGAGAASITVQFFAAFGFFFVGLLFVQSILGYGPLKSAFALMPMSLVVIPVSRQAPQLARRFGLRNIGVTGLSLIAIGFVILSQLDAGSSYLQFLPGLLVFAAGFALAAAPASESIVNGLPAGKQGVASAVNDTAREVGGALGIAVVGSAFTTGYESSLDIDGLSLPAEAVEAVESSSLAGPEVAARLPDPQLAEQLLDATRDAFMNGFSNAVMLAAGAAALGAVIVARRSPREVTAPVDQARIEATVS